MFSIMLYDNPSRSGNHKMLLGRIVAGSLDEEFRSAIGYWSADDYRRQWASAIDSIIVGGSKTALITSMEKKPTMSGALDWWPVFREKRMVYIRSQLLILSRLGRVFGPNDFTEFIGQRAEFDEDGNRISEWSCDIADLVAFREKSRV